MEMVDVEKFLKGACEIDRIREAIPRVMQALIAAAQKGTSSFDENQIVVSMPLEPYGPLRIVTSYTANSLGKGRDGRLNRYINVQFSSMRWVMGQGWVADTLSVGAALLLYKKLGEIIMATDAAIPDAHIAEQLNKIAKVAEG